MSVEATKPDRSRWVVPVVVAVIAAVATVVAAVVPFILDRGGGPPTGDRSTGPVDPRRSVSPAPSVSPDDAAAVDHTGFSVLIPPMLGTADLDRGGKAAPDRVPDIEVRRGDVAAAGGSRIALLPSAQYSPQICAGALERPVASVAAADLRVGTVLCVQTTMGMTGVIILKSVRLVDGELRQVDLEYVIWSRTP